MSYDSYEVPDAITPLVGYRGWMVKNDRLVSCFRDVEWPVGSPLQSMCISPTFGVMNDRGVEILPRPARHWVSPHHGCTCGIYGLFELPERTGPKETSFHPWPYDAIIGMVSGWGKMVIGTKGFRAEYAKPIALVGKRNPLIKKLALTYGLEVISLEEVHHGHR